MFFLVLVMQALFALTFPIGKRGLEYADPLFLTGLRMVIAGLVMLAYFWWDRRREKTQVLLPPLTLEAIFLFCKTSFFYVYLAFVPEFWALQSMSSFKSNLLWLGFPLVSAVLSFYLLGERLSVLQRVGLLVACVGMIPVLLVSEQAGAARDMICFSWPEFMMMVAVVSTAYAWFLIKRLLERGYPLVLINGITMLIGGLLCFGTEIIAPMRVPAYSSLLDALVYAIALVVIANIIAYQLYGYLLQTYSITFLSLSGFLCPVFGALISVCFLQEPLYVEYLISFILIVIGMALFYRDELRAAR